MANRRVSELNELLNTQVAATDLFLITDVSAVESKKIRADQLKTYALNGTASYSLVANSSSYSLFARSASWAPSTVSASYALSASYADWAKTASYVLSASYAVSSSWASRSFWATTASYSLTSSVQLVISSGLSNYADTASYLVYVPGFNNGTASAAISASWAARAATSSFLQYNGTFNGSASYALTASLARTASLVLTASYLQYTSTRPNGTASYSVSSSLSNTANYVKKPMPYGIFDPTVTSITASKIVSMSFSALDIFAANTFITVYGTATLFYTSSVADSGSITLGVMDQSNGTYYSLDTTWIGFTMGGVGSISGSMTQPFTLTGDQLLVGEWTLFVSASSPNIKLDTRRSPSFRVDSQASAVTVL